MTKRFLLFLFCKIFANKKPPSVREVPKGRRELCKADGCLCESCGPHMCGPYPSACRFVGADSISARREEQGFSYKFHPNGNSAFCLSMANILSRVMTRTAVMLDFSTLLPCPASSL